MGAGRSGLPVKCQTYVKKWLLGKMYDRLDEFYSKYMEKGNICEDDSIQTLANLYQLPLIKNEEFRENEFLTGTCDVIHEDIVYDVKNSWSCFTMPILEDDIPNKDYWWQLQGYMELWNVDHAKLCYTLNDCPDNLLEKEIYYEAKRLNCSADEIRDSVIRKHTYSDVEEWKRLKVFNITRDKEAIKEVYKRVEECQKYVDDIMSRLREKEKF